MLGQETAALESRPRNWLQRIWGVPDIHARQKWAAIWPHLAALPSDGLRVLDAGCGDGQWALELAARRPGWSVVGLDKAEDMIARAEASRRRLQLPNVQFVTADFRDAAFPAPFHVVLSVASSHYLAATGEGLRLFQTFAEWLAPEGLLCLLGPRSEGRDPFSPRLPHPVWHRVFSRDELEALCLGAGLRIDVLTGRIGNAGILAKQLAWAASDRSGALRALLYPLQWAMTMADQGGTLDGSDRTTLMWLLTARRQS